MLASSDGELAAVSKGSSSYTVTWRGASSPAGACKVTERSGRVTVFFPETCHGKVFLDSSEFSLIAEAQMPDSFARATPAVGNDDQWARLLGWLWVVQWLWLWIRQWLWARQ